MTRALKQAGLGPEDINYINAHGTGTKHNDDTESRAIRKVFAERAGAIPVSSTKSMHGHALGATGALEAAAIVAGMQGGCPGGAGLAVAAGALGHDPPGPDHRLPAGADVPLPDRSHRPGGGMMAGPRSRSIIISAANAAYYPLLAGLLRSVAQPVRERGIDLGIIDLGLADSQRKELKRVFGAALRVPPWDYDPKGFNGMSAPFFKAMTARPHLPRHFPGYGLYAWIDADCWVQDFAAILAYLDEAERAGFCVTPEVDRGYTPFMGSGAIFDWMFSCYARCFGPQEAQALVHYPMINSGVFAARADAPHWQLWSRRLGEALARLKEPYFFSEQTALNAAIHGGKLPAAFLPARYNWVCARRLPATGDGVVLCDPNPPYQDLAVVHLAAGAKNGRKTLSSPDGRTFVRSLRYNGHDDSGVGEDIVR